MTDAGWKPVERETPLDRARRAREEGTSPPRPERYERVSRDGLKYQGALTMAEVEERITRADDELAELTGVHMDLSEDAAWAESDWKRHRDTVIVRTVGAGERTAADYREALAREEIDPITGKPGSELYQRYKVTEARAGSSARAMRAIEARLNSFQTIAANLRRVAT